MLFSSNPVPFLVPHMVTSCPASITILSLTSEQYIMMAMGWIRDEGGKEIGWFIRVDPKSSWKTQSTLAVPSWKMSENQELQKPAAGSDPFQLSLKSPPVSQRLPVLKANLPQGEFSSEKKHKIEGRTPSFFFPSFLPLSLLLFFPSLLPSSTCSLWLTGDNPFPSCVN